MIALLMEQQEMSFNVFTQIGLFKTRTMNAGGAIFYAT